MGEAFIVAAARTAGGRKGSRLAGWHPADLAAQVLDALIERTGADPALIDDVIMGCVGQAGEQSTNVARNAVLASKLPESVPGTSVDRQCGSSQQALHFAAQAVMSGTMDCVIAAGVESMSRVPMGAPHVLAAKAGLGTYMSDAIQARYPGVAFSQFAGAEMIARKHDISREAMDAYALETHRRASAATRSGAFDAEIVALDITLPYVRERRQFDAAIGTFGLMQGKVADMYVALNSARAYVYSVARACDQGKTTRYDAAGAILLASENAVKVTLEAVQALGGAGYTKEWPVERLVRDAKLYDIGAGTNEIRRFLIGRELLGS